MLAAIPGLKMFTPDAGHVHEADVSPSVGRSPKGADHEASKPHVLLMTPPESAPLNGKHRVSQGVSVGSRSDPKARRISSGRGRRVSDPVSKLYASTVICGSASTSPTLGLKQLAERLRSVRQSNMMKDDQSVLDFIPPIMDAAPVAQSLSFGSTSESAKPTEPSPVVRARKRRAAGLATRHRVVENPSTEVSEDVIFCGETCARKDKRCRLHGKSRPPPFYTKRLSMGALATARAGLGSPSAATTLARDYLLARSVRELRSACRDKALPESGERHELIDSLVEYYARHSSKGPSRVPSQDLGMSSAEGAAHLKPQNSQEFTKPKSMAGQLNPRTRVLVAVEIESKNDGADAILQVGKLGTVLRIDGDGDACIDFGEHGMHWVLKTNFDSLDICAQTTSQQVVESTASAPLAPESRTAMHSIELPAAQDPAPSVEAGHVSVTRRLRFKQSGMVPEVCVPCQAKPQVVVAKDNMESEMDKGLPPHKRARLVGKTCSKDTANAANVVSQRLVAAAGG